MAAKHKTTKKQAKPKTKVVYRTKTVYVKQKDNEDDNPFKQTNQMIGTGMTAIVGIGMAGAIAKAFK